MSDTETQNIEFQNGNTVDVSKLKVLDTDISGERVDDFLNKVVKFIFETKQSTLGEPTIEINTDYSDILKQRNSSALSYVRDVWGWDVNNVEFILIHLRKDMNNISAKQKQTIKSHLDFDTRHYLTNYLIIRVSQLRSYVFAVVGATNQVFNSVVEKNASKVNEQLTVLSKNTEFAIQNGLKECEQKFTEALSGIKNNVETSYQNLAMLKCKVEDNIGENEKIKLSFDAYRHANDEMIIKLKDMIVTLDRELTEIKQYVMPKGGAYVRI